jgi:hypothetical protein
MYLLEISICSLAVQLATNRNFDEMLQHLHSIVLQNTKCWVQISGFKDVACYAIHPINSMREHKILKEGVLF